MRDYRTGSLKLVLACGFVWFTIAEHIQAALITFDPAPTVSFSGGKLNSDSDHFTSGTLYVEAFWARQFGSPSGFFLDGHFHIGSDTNSTGNVELQHFNGPSDLQGVFIENADLSSFSLTSLNYRVRDASAGPIDGFSSSDVTVLLATTFDPTQSVVSQFTAFSVGTGSTLYSTLPITGFENVSRVYIASSASVSFDNITTGLAVPTSLDVPEPASIAVWGVGTLCLGLVARHRRRQPAI